MAAVITIATFTPLASEAAVVPKLITRCGETLTSGAYVLATDLTCSTGFVVQASPNPIAVVVTVNLGGHRLQGTGVGTALRVSGNPDAATVTISNGRVDHWANGVVAETGHLVVQKLQIDTNTIGIGCEGICAINDTVISNNNTAVTTYELGLVNLNSSVISGNREASHLLTFSRVNYQRNVFYNNTIGLNITGYATTALTENVFLDNSTAVQAVVPEETGYDVTMTNNLFTSNGDGVRLDVAVDQGRALLTGNTAVRNTRYGIYTPGATDLGSNRAGSNGARPQCVGVACGVPDSSLSKPWLTAAQIEVLSIRSRRGRAADGSTPANPDPAP
jgi:hypothetical protein